MRDGGGRMEGRQNNVSGDSITISQIGTCAVLATRLTLPEIQALHIDRNDDEDQHSIYVLLPELVMLWGAIEGKISISRGSVCTQLLG